MQSINMKRLASLIHKVDKWGYDAAVMVGKEVEDLGPSWKEVAKSVGKVKMAVYISRGFAEDVLCLIEGSKGYEVGTGEALRPYLQHYHGPNEDVAVATFIGKAQGYPNPKDEEPEM